MNITGLKNHEADVDFQKKIPGIINRLSSSPYPLILILLLALSIRLPLLITTPSWLIVEHFDSGRYLRAAGNILAGNGFSSSESPPYDYETYRTPGYPLFLVACTMIFGNPIKGARIIQLILSLTLCLLVYLIAKHIMDRTTGLIAAFLFATYPFEIYYFSKIMTEEPAAFLLTAGILFWILAEKQTGTVKVSAWAIISGLILSIGVLVKPTTFLLPFFLIIPCILFNRNYETILMKVLPFIAAFLSVLIIQGFENKLHTGRFFITPPIFWGNVVEGLSDDIYSRYPDSKELHEKWVFASSTDLVPLEEELKETALSFIKEYPGIYAKHFVIRIVDNWIGKFNSHFTPTLNRLTSLVSYVYLVMALTGLFISRKKWKSFLPLIIVIVYFSLAGAFLKDNARYTIPGRPMLIIAAAAAFTPLLKKLKIIS